MTREKSTSAEVLLLWNKTDTYGYELMGTTWLLAQDSNSPGILPLKYITKTDFVHPEAKWPSKQ